MARGKKATKKANGKQPRRSVPRSIVGQFDKAAQDYAKLLLDPCNAPLSHPVGAPTGGILIRVQTIVSLGGGAGNTASVIHWTPGAIGSNNVEFMSTSVANGNTASVFAASASTPGKTFLAANASDCRCVAACAKIMYDGAESARAGRIAYGQTLGGFLLLTSVDTPQNIASSLEHHERMPQKHIELRWRPNEYDLMMTDPGTSTGGPDKDRRSALTFAGINLPAATFTPIMLTAVYEYVPLPSLGLTQNLRSTSHSSYSFQQVVSALDRAAKSPWVTSYGTKLIDALPTVFAAATAATGFGRIQYRP